MEGKLSSTKAKMYKLVTETVKIYYYELQSMTDFISIKNTIINFCKILSNKHNVNFKKTHNHY